MKFVGQIGTLASHGGRCIVNGVSGILGAAAQAPNALALVTLVTLVARTTEQKIRECCEQTLNTPPAARKNPPAADGFLKRAANVYYAFNKTELTMIAAGSLVVGFLATKGLHRFLPSMS